MRSVASTPYLVPPGTCVAPDAWTIDEGGRTLPARLDHWDPFTDLEVFRTITVDCNEVRRHCLLGDDATLALCATWHSSRTRLAENADSLELGIVDDRLQGSLVLRIPGAVSGGRLTLTTKLILRFPGTTYSAIAPRREGAALWQDDYRVTVEGRAARFPVTALDFSVRPGLPTDGAWALDWNPKELDSPVLGAVRLLVNAENEMLVSALRTGSRDAHAQTVRQFVMFDIARALVHGALQQEEFVRSPQRHDEGTVGHMLFELLSSCWPGVPIETLASRRSDETPRLDAELQAHVALMR